MSKRKNSKNKPRRPYGKKWVMKGGFVVPICSMDNTHLLYTIRKIEKWCVRYIKLTEIQCLNMDMFFEGFDAESVLEDLQK